MNILDMKDFIKNYIESHGCTFIEINDIDIPIVYHFYKNDDIELTTNLSGIVLNYIGFYYKHQTPPNYELAEKYYLIAIEKGHVIAMYNLAHMYQYQTPLNYELAEKYYLMAIEKGSVHAMNKLAHMYRHQTPPKLDLAEKYYLMAIEKGHIKTMNNLACMYEYQRPPKLDLAEKYYLMAIEKGHVNAINNLAHMYEYQTLHKHDLAEKYYLMAIEKGHVDAINNLAHMYEHQTPPKLDLAEKYYLLAISKGNYNFYCTLLRLYLSKKINKDNSTIDLFEKYKIESNSDYNISFVYGLILEYHHEKEYALPYFKLSTESGNKIHIKHFIQYLIHLNQKNELIDFLIQKLLMKNFYDNHIYKFIEHDIYNYFINLISNKINLSRKIKKLTLNIDEIVFSPSTISLQVIKNHFDKIQLQK